MNNLPEEIIKYNINSFLDLNDKISLLKVNKHMKQIQKYVLGFHIGTIINYFLGMGKERLVQDSKILMDDSLEYIKDISNYLIHNEISTYIKPKVIGRRTLPLKTLIQIYRSNIDECKNILLKNEFKYNTSYSKEFTKMLFLKKRFYNTYAILG